MNIGFVSTWFERGAAYVTKAYIDLLEKNNEIFIYARGGEHYAKKDPKWDSPNVTWAPKIGGTRIVWSHMKRWIDSNKIDTIFFNEQHEFDIIAKIKMYRPDVKIGSYIDYYKISTINNFNLYDYLICNTKRHFDAFKDHKQVYYVPWGTDIELFKPREMKVKPSNQIVFFHSMGMSNRKGTDLLIDAFIGEELYKEAKLIIHTQKELDNNIDYNKYNIEVINKTVSAPGLYHLGDVYVYPTKLEGLGLTTYEALSCGLPVITTNYAPMNEVITDDVGRLIDVEKVVCREDAYYWPLAISNVKSLAQCMKYYIDNKESIHIHKSRAREFAVKELSWIDRKDQIQDIFTQSKIYTIDKEILYSVLKKTKRKFVIDIARGTMGILPDSIKYLLSKINIINKI